MLVLVFSGLPSFGAKIAEGGGGCGPAACVRHAVPVSCCQEPAGGEGFCPHSGGRCECSAAPEPDPRPSPQAPLPRPDRDSLAAAAVEAVRLIARSDPESDPSGGSAVSIGPLAGFTHNEVQALLGVWRT